MEGEDEGGLSRRMTNAKIAKYLTERKLRQDEKRNKDMQLMRHKMENIK